jgi:septum formation protein
VLTAVRVVGPDGSAEDVVATALVTFAAADPERLAGYVAGGEPMDKAGAYALQGQGAALVESVDGDPTTVIGLPLRATVDALARIGLPPPAFGA